MIPHITKTMPKNHGQPTKINFSRLVIFFLLLNINADIELQFVPYPDYKNKQMRFRRQPKEVGDGIEKPYNPSSLPFFRGMGI
jgi:hypothetical protein